MTAADVIGMLRRHYLPEGRPPGGIFAPEIQCPAGQRRADLLWMPTGWSTGSGIIGHEVKVTRADVMAELADATKADAWARYCTHWWLVVADPSLIDGLAIPEAWGVMAPPSGRRTRSMTILRDAPKLKPIDMAPAYARIAAWTAADAAARGSQQRAEIQILKRDLEYERKRRSDVEVAAAGHASPHAQRIGRIVERIRAEGRGSLSDASDEDIVVAVLDLARARSAAREIRHVADSLIASVRRLQDGTWLSDAEATLRKISAQADAAPVNAVARAHGAVAEEVAP